MNRTQRLSTEETPPATQAVPRSPEPRSLEMSLLRLLVSPHQRNESRMAITGHNRPIGSHFHSGGVEFSYLGEDFDEAFG